MPESDLVVHPAAVPAADGTFLDVTPDSAGWTYVGFEVLALASGVVAKRDTRRQDASAGTRAIPSSSSDSSSSAASR